MKRTNSQEPAVVVQRAYDFTLWLIQKVEKFPRALRFSLGERLLNAAFDLLSALTEAAYSSSKIPLLDLANQKLNLLRILVRLGVDLKGIPSSAQEFAAAQLEEIGRMAGGWRRSSAKRAES